MKKQVNAAKLAAFAGAAAVGGFIYLIAPGKIRARSRNRLSKTVILPTVGCINVINPCRRTRWPRSSAPRPYGYGIELDVQLSKDGQVVVFHDDTLNRVCGVDARVDSKDPCRAAAAEPLRHRRDDTSVFRRS